MTISGDDLLGSILASLERISYIEPEDIPGIDLYMDQVTGFLDKRLRSTVRNPGDGRIMTKTMINNYAKNDLIPPPIKKKYSKEHILLLIFIYYYKGILSIGDIQKLLEPVTKEYFDCGKSFDLESIYREVVELEKGQLEGLKLDVIKKYKEAEETFGDAPESGKEFLRKFAFICMLSYDVYVKKLMIEKMIDELAKVDLSAKPKPRKEAKPKEAKPKEMKENTRIKKE
ncbi:MAG: DUF1836 domain-containing protein [Lachnospiraceae bacterium]|nr:DUF1836 domain-containing protein [Lachnospiraceae bacterium]